jgi:GNAT superfamily N-acetyltransferase
VKVSASVIAPLSPSTAVRQAGAPVQNDGLVLQHVGMAAADPIEIVHGDLAAFHAVVAGDRTSADTQRYLQDLMDARLTRPDWCLVAQAGGRPLARVALWGEAPLGRPSDIVLLDLPWDQPHLALGTRLIERCAARVREVGIGTLRHVLDDPPRRPQWQHGTGARISFLADLGFTVRRCTRRYEWGGVFRTRPTPRLQYRGLPALGVPALKQLVQQVVEGSLDRIDREQVQAQGASAHARWLLQLLQQMDHQPPWWEAGYAGREAVGLVLPTAGPGFGTIGYMGVLPRWRGQRYADELLARGTATLLAAGLKRLVSDTDIANAPMAEAFARLGWNEFGRRTEYGLAL